MKLNPHSCNDCKWLKIKKPFQVGKVFVFDIVCKKYNTNFIKDFDTTKQYLKDIQPYLRCPKRQKYINYLKLHQKLSVI